MLKGKSLLDYVHLFSPNEYVKYENTTLKYFQYLKRLRWKEYIVLSMASIENLKTLKYP